MQQYYVEFVEYFVFGFVECEMVVGFVVDCQELNGSDEFVVDY